MTKVKLSTHFSIDLKSLENFKKLLTECLDIVRQKEKGKGTLQYDCYLDDTTYLCIILETYANGEAFFTHMDHVGEVLGKMIQISKIQGYVLGPVPEKVATFLGKSGAAFLNLEGKLT